MNRENGRRAVRLQRFENGPGCTIESSEPRFEFHLSRAARDRFDLDDTLASTSGRMIFANLRLARDLASRMNEASPPSSRNGHPAVRAGELHALALIGEVLHYVLALYRKFTNPGVSARLWTALVEEFGDRPLREALQAFVGGFPPAAVARGEQTATAWIEGESSGVPHVEVVVEELLLLSLANENPAFHPFTELFDDSALRSATIYERMLASVRTFFAKEPAFGPESLPLLEVLEAPMRASPESLPGQLAYMKDEWGLLLSRDPSGPSTRRLGQSLDTLREELGGNPSPGGGPGPVFVPRFESPPTAPAQAPASPPSAWAQGESRVPGVPPSTKTMARIARYSEFDPSRRLPPELVTEREVDTAGGPRRYSTDLDWMPRVVMLAKNAHVWLAQLTRDQGRPIARLDAVPDEELDRMASFGITALWLIGIWRRSPASREIKRRTGNTEALASAYSLDDYEIAEDLGGEDAYDDLRGRAWLRGIRLAIDMVPNHVGIVSRWMAEHPEYFLQLPEPPWPHYRFEGPDLSDDPAYGVFLEDGYWDRTDAAVVFKRLDRATGESRYIYHGNDGTGTPWNDTAQLDFMNPAVREAVTGQILRVAHLSPIIRFDAAMVLSKRHYQRLWFPEPGSGGDIPTRAEHGLTRAEFDARMPEEFWREVVVRVAAEAPETLLLAEAFWLMESYFVRTLGMHRVYNSAFMNMLRLERNASYRLLVKNTLAFDPAILERFVNFMNNPDEKPAVEQFGRADRYFGVATLMVTMPGLPMIGHGQIEGLREKYGMEFAAPRLDESADPEFVARHERQIVPLLRRRALFSGSRHFALYDLIEDSGKLNDNVFAYSNRSGTERALVLFNNSGRKAAGWISPLVDALGLNSDDGRLVVFRDAFTGREYPKDLDVLNRRGLRVELGPWQTTVFLDVKQVRESEGGLTMRLAASTEGSTPQFDDARTSARIGAGLEAFHAVLTPERLGEFTRLFSSRTAAGSADARTAFAASLEEAIGTLIESVAGRRSAALDSIRRDVEAAFALPAGAETRAAEAVAGDSTARFETILFSWIIARAAGASRSTADQDAAVADAVIERGFSRAFARMGCDAWMSRRRLLLVTLLSEFALDWPLAATEMPRLGPIVQEATAREYLMCNWHQGVEWFHKESWEDLVFWFATITAAGASPARRTSTADLSDVLVRAGAESGYRFETLLDLLQKEVPAASAVERSPAVTSPGAPGKPFAVAAPAAPAVPVAVARPVAAGKPVAKTAKAAAKPAAPGRARAPKAAAGGATVRKRKATKKKGD